MWITTYWRILKEIGGPDHLTCFLRNLYAGKEAKVRNGYGTMDWFKIGKGVCHGCVLLHGLFNFYAEYIILNAGLDESQARNEVARKNVSNVRYADDTTLMAESEAELKSLLMKVKEENEKTGIKLNIQKTKIIVSGPIILWQIHREEMETVADIIFLGSKSTVDGDCIHDMKHLIQKTKWGTTDWKKLFPKHISEKGSILNQERICTQIVSHSSLKFDKDWKTHLAKKYKQMCA